MKHLPAVPEGHEVTVILKCGQEIEGRCILIGDQYVRISCGDATDPERITFINNSAGDPCARIPCRGVYTWHIDAEDIAAFGIGGKA